MAGSSTRPRRGVRTPPLRLGPRGPLVIDCTEAPCEATAYSSSRPSSSVSLKPKWRSATSHVPQRRR